MIQVIQQTREEKIAMYMKLPKKKLAELLCNCNEHIELIGPVVVTNNVPKYCDCKRQFLISTKYICDGNCQFY